MKKIKSTQKGITLIALVITIIVLLILAGVTINLTLGENGIFRTAQQAAKNYTNAQDKEIADIGNFENILANVIEDVTGNNNLPEEPIIIQQLSTIAQPGDYIKYMPTAKSFSMTPEQTGQDANQDFNTGNYKDTEGNPGLWQVLYNDEIHGLQIISADIVGKLRLGNNTDEAKTKLGYNNAVDTLNTFCSNYVDIKYATSGRSVGSDPIHPKDILDLTNPEHTVTLQFPYNDSTESGCKIADENYKTDYDAMKVATNQNANGIYVIGKSYWMASRNLNSSSNYANFNVGYCLYNEIPGGAMWEVWSGGSTHENSGMYGVRPVITLKSEIKTSDGDGTKGNPFKLVAQ